MVIQMQKSLKNRIIVQKILNLLYNGQFSPKLFYLANLI